MFNRTLLIGLVLFLLAGCRNKNAADALFIDYELLNKLEVELIEEITESPNYISGQLRDLILMDDGTLLVSDLGTVTIEQFSPEGEHIGTVAKEGRGPGELSSFFLLFESAKNSLVVLHHGATRQIDYFDREPGTKSYKFIKSKILERIQDRYLTLIGPISDSTFIAKVENTLYLQRQINVSTDYTDYIETPYAIVDEFETIIIDSLHMLRTPNLVLEHVEGAIIGGMPPYQYEDRLKIINDRRYVIARPDSSALYIYNDNHELKEYIYLPVKPRKVTKEDIENYFRDREGVLRSRKEKRIPEFKPPFLDIWVSNDHVLLHTDNNKAGKEMVVLTMEGKPVGRFYLSEHDDIRYFREDRIYTLHKDPNVGHSIRVYQVNI